jgi:Lon protease-like protein
MVELAMFPLGTVLLPGGVLPLHVFEPRYRTLVRDCLAQDDPEFGVVLIERGPEAGGDDQRFGIATVAEIRELGALGDDIAVIARGGRRVEVVEWLEDDPHPVAVVRDLPELEWDERLRSLRDQAEFVVRRAVLRASEFVELPWAADAELSDDPVASSWQLAGIAPIGPLDQLALLRSTNLAQLLARLMELTIESGETIAAAFAVDDLDAELAAFRGEEEPGEGPAGEGPAGEEPDGSGDDR